MNKMYVCFINDLNGDRVKIKIGNFEKEYAYGYNTSWNRKSAKHAQEDHENAIKYNWKNYYPLKPFIGDIISNLKKNIIFIQLFIQVIMFFSKRNDN